MSFDIPNYAGATHPFQSAPDSVDFETVVAGSSLTGVVSGCAVTAQGVPDMTVAVAAGNVALLGVSVAITPGNVTIGAADATNPRIDLIVSDGAGALSNVAGVAAAVPLMSTPPASRVVLAAVYVAALDVAINAGDITDKRVIVLPFGTAAGTIAQGNASASAATIFPFYSFIGIGT